MNLTIDIEGKTSRILRELSPGFSADSFVSGLLSFLGIDKLLAKRRINKRLKQTLRLLDDYILVLEGFQGHIAELEPKKAEEFLAATKKSIKAFDKFEEEMAMDGFMPGPELRNKFKYNLKTLYKTEALLHRAVTKNAEPIKTPTYLKEGLAKMSQAAIQKSL